MCSITLLELIVTLLSGKCVIVFVICTIVTIYIELLLNNGNSQQVKRWVGDTQKVKKCREGDSTIHPYVASWDWVCVVRTSGNIQTTQDSNRPPCCEATVHNVICFSFFRKHKFTTTVKPLCRPLLQDFLTFKTRTPKKPFIPALVFLWKAKCETWLSVHVKQTPDLCKVLIKGSFLGIGKPPPANVLLLRGELVGEAVTRRTDELL